MKRFLILIAMAISLNAEPANRIGLGYEDGLSVRYFPAKMGVGLTLSIPERGDYGSIYYTRDATDTIDTTTQSNKIRGKGLAGMLSVYYRIDHRPLTLMPYLSCGYGYSQSYRKYFSASASPSSLIFGEIRNTVSGEIGIMPGIIYKRVSLECKLGLKGSMVFTKTPKDANNDSYINSVRKTSSTERILALKYPYGILTGIIVHFWF